ncbi:acetate/propionate family kinase [Candidatus Nitrospira allomarina]|uniref:Acetate kinase n=1 Tax=Candidatus Nitrospira allomarina TaxID=3020900 RepID=A0AA96GH12_9BACT|nr:acetate/propionate family kinase [Candidatus Nitrospira allomarina]WNM58369.1 acetate/propionate family kinase [Candidatus Nitrospira allomarina]
MRILILNSGSSSLKFRLVVYPTSSPTADTNPLTLRQGIVTGIGKEASLKISAPEHAPFTATRQDVLNHGQAVAWVWESLQDLSREDGETLKGPGITIDAVGVRVVHGGHRFTKSVLIDETVLGQIEELSPLAPLHNPPCLEGIYQIRALLGPQIPIVAVFDTSFHRTLPDHARTYAIPLEWTAQHGIERFGFHGIAHASLAYSYARFSGRSLEGTRLITFQLGQGCSVSAIQNGAVVDTSMGFTPLEGLVMGTRCGDMDPAIIGYVAEHGQLSIKEIDHLLNTQSGLLGLSGQTSDMRQLLQAVEQQDPRATLAIEVFCHRARKYLGAYLAILGGADAVIFGGGIGERASDIRARICQGMDWCGLSLDYPRNLEASDVQAGEAISINGKESAIKLLVIGTDEESWVARETFQGLRNAR